MPPRHCFHWILFICICCHLPAPLDNKVYASQKRFSATMDSGLLILIMTLKISYHVQFFEAPIFGISFHNFIQPIGCPHVSKLFRIFQACLNTLSGYPVKTARIKPR